MAAYRWGGAAWERVGTVALPVRRETKEAAAATRLGLDDAAMSSTRKEELDGEAFDRVITVEIDSASRGFLVLRLGFDHGDDPAEVARGFCAKHALLDEYIPQIGAYVASNQ